MTRLRVPLAPTREDFPGRIQDRRMPAEDVLAEHSGRPSEFLLIPAPFSSCHDLSRAQYTSDRRVPSAASVQAELRQYSPIVQYKHRRVSGAFGSNLRDGATLPSTQHLEFLPFDS